ncbi:hypothetical protein DAETH_37920 (plasmid) [Deinococcus aetherius]|uniref:Uncharacterized protein n=1 Tax=Deinococcus aetherius TaxID=200252 RepID=A0ABN6RPP6_9DEIO|nr:hypothetical protein [Deinococcus aetherius]BDP43823.1 hypothetical protein DAETH_37920 [Deinococcus aetherius]
MNPRRNDPTALSLREWLQIYERLITADLMLCFGILICDPAAWPGPRALLFGLLVMVTVLVVLANLRIQGLVARSGGRLWGEVNHD